MGVPTIPPECAMAWLWTDTLADLLETIDRVEPDALGPLRSRPVAYRLDDGVDPVALARAVWSEAAAATTAPPGRSAAPGPLRSSRPG